MPVESALEKARRELDETMAPLLYAHERRGEKEQHDIYAAIARLEEAAREEGARDELDAILGGRKELAEQSGCCACCDEDFCDGCG